MAVVLAAFTCSSNDPTSDCPTPVPGSRDADVLARTRAAAGFTLLYPCFLPAAQVLSDASVTGDPGRQQTEMVFSGPYDLRIRQSQLPPPVAPDPAGSQRSTISLFPNVKATFLQRNDGSSKALYHLFWEQNDVYYELQALGPGQQQRQILLIARSLQ